MPDAPPWDSNSLDLWSNWWFDFFCDDRALYDLARQIYMEHVEDGYSVRMAQLRLEWEAYV